MKKTFIIILITTAILGALFVRLWGLEKSPISVGFDEASLGYNAYSIYLTGKDEYGTPYPLSLRSFNDFKPALYAYLTIPFIHFFDLNQSTVRAPSAVMGVISLIFLFLIFKKISGKSTLISLGIISLVSFFPWRLHFSRVAFEANVSMAFFTGAVWFLLNFDKNKYYKIGTIAFSILSIYSYHSSRVAIPLILFLILIDPLSKNFKDLLKKPITQLLYKLWPLMIVLLFYLPLLLETGGGLLLTRLSQTNVFSHFYPFTPRELILTSVPWLNFAAHPLYYLGGLISGHLFAYLSPKNLSLLIYPGVIKSAQVISGTGMLGFFGGTMFIIGVLSQLKKLILEKEKRVLVYWFIAGIIPAAISWEWYYPLRALNIYPSIDIVAGFGILTLVSYFLKLKSKLISYILIFILIITGVLTSFYNVLNEYNFGARDTNGEFQPGGYKEGVPLLLSLKDKYETVYIDSVHAQNYTIFWFYMKYPPENIQRIAARRNAPGVIGPPTIDFDNFVYKKFDWPSDKNRSNFIYWTSSEVKEEEIRLTPGTDIYRVEGQLGNYPVTIITKD
jgi:hypothetical protein